MSRKGKGGNQHYVPQFLLRPFCSGKGKQLHAFEKKLQGQSGFAGTGIALNQIKAIARESAAQNAIQAFDAC